MEEEAVENTETEAEDDIFVAEIEPEGGTNNVGADMDEVEVITDEVSRKRKSNQYEIDKNK